MKAGPLQIFTLTGNLLAERTLDFRDWAPGRTQRAESESFQVGGKGINVSRMLARFGVEATALCFTGGHLGAECLAWLTARGLSHRAFSGSTPTRTGIVIRRPGGRETTFLGPDAAPDADAIAACAQFLGEQPDGGVLAICGSFPGWEGAAFDPLRKALDAWINRSTLIADTYGPPLAWLAKRPVSLVKLNATEFRGLIRPNRKDGSSLTDPELEAAAKETPVRNWIVTDGPGLVWVREENSSPIYLEPPKVSEVSATGSGDVMLACVIEGWMRRHMPLREAAVFALPYAASNAAHSGVAEFEMPEN